MPVPVHKAAELIDRLTVKHDELTARRTINEAQALIPTAPSLSIRADLLTAIGIAYCHLGDEEKCLSHHRNAVRTYPQDHHPLMNYGVSLFRFGHRAGALEQFIAAIEKPSGRNDSLALGNLALGLWDTGLQRDALDALAAAHDNADPTSVPRSLRLADLTAMLGQDRTALTLAARVAAAVYQVALRLDAPELTIRDAPPAFQQMALQFSELARAYLLATRIRPELTVPGQVPAGQAPVEVGDSGVELEAYQQTKGSRERATRSEVGTQ